MIVKTYETIIILTENLTEIEYESCADYYKYMISHLPAIKIKTEKIGKSKLAYPVRNNDYGWYLVFRYKSYDETVKKLENELKDDDHVLKFVTSILDNDKYIPDPDYDLAKVTSEQKIIPDALDVLLGLADYPR